MSDKYKEFDDNDKRKDFLHQARETLKERGLNVYFKFYRPYKTVLISNDRGPFASIRLRECSKGNWPQWFPPLPRGGETHCFITRGKEVVLEHIEPCSQDENFCYDKGKCVALSKAMEELGIGPKCKVFRLGNVFRVGILSKVYILARHSNRNFIFVALAGGNRWSEPFPHKRVNKVTLEELERSIDGWPWEFLAESVEEYYKQKQK